MRPHPPGFIVAAVLTLGVAVACPGRGDLPSGEEALEEVMKSAQVKRYAAAAGKAGADDLAPLERAALGYLWLRDGESARAIAELEKVNPRSLEKFERRLFYLVRAVAYYGQGWMDLAGKEFREADLMRLDAAEVNLEGTNTEPILLTDLLARGGLLLAVPDAGLATVDLEPLESIAAPLSGGQKVLDHLRAELDRRRGGSGGIADHLGMGTRELSPVLAGVKARERGEAALAAAEAVRKKMAGGEKP
jgi:hypothetical protein